MPMSFALWKASGVKRLGRDLRQVAVGGGGMEDREARVAADREVLERHHGRRHLVQVPADGGVVQGRVAGVVLQREVLRGQGLRGQARAAPRTSPPGGSACARRRSSRRGLRRMVDAESAIVLDVPKAIPRGRPKQIKRPPEGARARSSEFDLQTSASGKHPWPRMYPADSSPAAAKDAILVVDDEVPILQAFVAALSPYFEVDVGHLGAGRGLHPAGRSSSRS